MPKGADVMQRYLPWAAVGLLLIVSIGCSRQPTGGTTASRPASSAAATADLASGKKIFDSNCARCHGQQGQLIPDWKSKARKMSDTQIKDQIRNGGGGMPPFKDKLSSVQVDQVAAYAKQLASK